MSHAKTERNKRLIKLRNSNPDKWSWVKLGEEFNIHKSTALLIYQRYTLGKPRVYKPYPQKPLDTTNQ